MLTSQDDQEMLAFWTARLGEDEHTARNACHDGPGDWTTDDSYAVSVVGLPPGADVFSRAVAFNEGSPSEEQAAHTPRHDPSRVLRDVAAARRRLARIDEAIGAGHDSYDLASALLPLEVAAYDNHPDYKEAWRP